MPERFEIQAKVVAQTGKCGNGHRVGDEFILTGKAPGGICMSALHCMYANYRVLRYGGQFKGPDPYVCKVSCPDPLTTVIWEMRRIPKPEKTV
jgi:uncharacterized repeat protein (TIGR04076 family)